VLALEAARGEARSFEVASIAHAKAGAGFDRGALPPVPPAPSVVV
jgi:hypothetical protein